MFPNFYSGSVPYATAMLLSCVSPNSQPRRLAVLFHTGKLKWRRFPVPSTVWGSDPMCLPSALGTRFDARPA
jgi:hypothetical protein